MKKTKRSVFITLLAILFIISGCNMNKDNQEEPKENEQAEPNQDENDETKDNEDDVEKHEEILLPEPILQRTDSGKAVEYLQKALNQIGYEFDVTGTFDYFTTWAITDLQFQHEELDITGLYDVDTKNKLEELLEGDEQMEEAKLPKPSENKATNKQVIENPYDVLDLINKENLLPSDYEPEDLTVPDVRFSFEEDHPKKQLRKVAADALEELFAAADLAGHELFALSGYRSYDTQASIFASNAEKHGEEKANTFSARPGESEHQSGLTMDVTSRSANFDLIIEFGQTPEGIWLAENAHEFGFIIRFLEGKEDITKYQYEPWHIRYVGIKAATEIKEKEVTLEEYFAEKE